MHARWYDDDDDDDSVLIRSGRLWGHLFDAWTSLASSWTTGVNLAIWEAMGSPLRCWDEFDVRGVYKHIEWLLTWVDTENNLYIN